MNTPLQILSNYIEESPYEHLEEYLANVSEAFPLRLSENRQPPSCHHVTLSGML
eukprot:Gb_06954 [translate_table: standard]